MKIRAPLPGSKIDNLRNTIEKQVGIKVHIFQESYKNLRNLHHRFDTYYTHQQFFFQPNLSGNGLNWLSYLAGNSITAPTNFLYLQHNFILIKKIIPQTTFLPTIWTDIISELGGVYITSNPR